MELKLLEVQRMYFCLSTKTSVVEILLNLEIQMEKFF